MQQNTSNLVNMSHISGDGEVSFDYEKILEKRNQNIKSAFENNLNDKWE